MRLRFGHRLVGLDVDTGELTFETATPHGADVVLASDGAYSAVRPLDPHGLTFSQDYLDHGYKELTIPARDGEFALDPARCTSGRAARR